MKKLVLLLLLALPFCGSSQTLSSYILEQMHCPNKKPSVNVGNALYESYMTDCCVIFINDELGAYLIPVCFHIDFADSVSQVNDKIMRKIGDGLWNDGNFTWQEQENAFYGKFFIITKNETGRN